MIPFTRTNAHTGKNIISHLHTLPAGDNKKVFVTEYTTDNMTVLVTALEI